MDGKIQCKPAISYPNCTSLQLICTRVMLTLGKRNPVKTGYVPSHTYCILHPFSPQMLCQIISSSNWIFFVKHKYDFESNIYVNWYDAIYQTHQLWWKKFKCEKNQVRKKRKYFQRKKEMNDIYLKCFDFRYLFSLMEMDENRNSFSIVECECLVEH